MKKIIVIVGLLAGLGSQASPELLVTGSAGSISLEQRCSDGVSSETKSRVIEMALENAMNKAEEICQDREVIKVGKDLVRLGCAKSMAEGGSFYTPWVHASVQSKFICN